MCAGTGCCLPVQINAARQKRELAAESSAWFIWGICDERLPLVAGIFPSQLHRRRGFR